MADTIKCPGCGGNLVFDADTQKLVCEYCGSSFLPDEIKNDVEELVNETSTYEEQFELPKADESADSSEPNENVMEFVCNACGASVVADKLQSAAFCAFCGSPALIGQKLTKEFRPSYIIPFKMGKEKAVEGFLKWCKGGRLAPFGFVSNKNIEKLTGLYVPYWLYSIDAHMDRETDANTVESVTVGNTVTTTTKYYKVTRVADFSWKNIPLDGESKIDDDLMEAIEPFEYKDLVPYDYKYLPGFFADVYDLDAESLEERAVNRAKSYVEEEYKKSLACSERSDKPYSSTKLINKDDKYGNISAEYALLPVWFMNYKYLGKTYTFAMNGQTGEVAGKPPVSMVKRILLYMVALAVLTVVTKIIVGLMLGGYVG